jgi:signal peptidase I
MALENQFADALGCDLVAEVARTFGCVRLRVFGTSMVPAVRPGDVLSVEGASLGELSPGEIVVFARAGRLIAHRLVAKTESTDEGHVVTRGDRVRQDDGIVSSAQLVGKVVSIERGGLTIPSHSQLSLTQRVICWLLRASDRVTHLYLRLAAL